MPDVAKPQTLPRTPERTRVLMTGTLFTPAGAHRVLIRDLSRGGAQVYAEDAIPADCDAVFKRGSIFVAARVAWSTAREAGLQFYRELSPSEVDSAFHAVVNLNR